MKVISSGSNKRHGLMAPTATRLAAKVVKFAQQPATWTRKAKFLDRLPICSNVGTTFGLSKSFASPERRPVNAEGEARRADYPRNDDEFANNPGLVTRTSARPWSTLMSPRKESEASAAPIATDTRE
jgi:hypothetical protein